MDIKDKPKLSTVRKLAKIMGNGGYTEQYIYSLGYTEWELQSLIEEREKESEKD